MAKKKSIDKKAKLKCIRLGWEILAHKFIYYEGSQYKLKPITDQAYDKIETEYRELCEELGEKPTAADMVGFDDSGGSARMVKQHMIANKGKLPGTRAEVKEKIKEVRKEVNAYMETLQEVLEELSINEKVQKKIRVRMKKRMKP